LVIFDCDGVVVDSERVVQDVDLRMIADLGWPISREEIFEQHLGRTEEAVTANIEQAIGRPVPDDFPRARQAAYERAFAEHLTAVPGVRAAAESLRTGGYDTCIASSSSHSRLRLTLGLTQMAQTFGDRVYSADDVDRGKPAPDLFLHAAKQMGHAPEACVVVEDSPNGVTAARTARMKVIGYAALTPGHMLDEADVVVTERYRIQRQFACSLEGRGVLAEWDRNVDELTIWTSSQIVHITRDLLASVLGLPEHRIRVLVPRIGGGFGAKFHFYPEETAVALAARATGRPVRWVEDRIESYLGRQKLAPTGDGVGRIRRLWRPHDGPKHARYSWSVPSSYALSPSASTVPLLAARRAAVRSSPSELQAAMSPAAPLM
jgi:HAD superfamily hydrolase (TIGR01509 family)